MQYFLMGYSYEMIMDISELEGMIKLDNFFLDGSEFFSMFVFEFHVHFKMEKFFFGFKLIWNDEASLHDSF